MLATVRATFRSFQKLRSQIARIFSLRRRRGFLIANRVRVVDGVKHGEFRLGSRPIPLSKELRGSAGLSNSCALNQKQGSGSLFGDLRPGRYPD